MLQDPGREIRGCAAHFGPRRAPRATRRTNAEHGGSTVPDVTAEWRQRVCIRPLEHPGRHRGPYIHMAHPV
jgi:hypothetical protein